MQTSIKNIAQTIKDHERQILYTALAISVVGLVLYRAGVKDHNRFLREINMYDAYYALVD